MKKVRSNNDSARSFVGSRDGGTVGDCDNLGFLERVRPAELTEYIVDVLGVNAYDDRVDEMMKKIRVCSEHGTQSRRTARKIKFFDNFGNASGGHGEFQCRLHARLGGRNY